MYLFQRNVSLWDRSLMINTLSSSSIVTNMVSVQNLSQAPRMRALFIKVNSFGTPCKLSKGEVIMMNSHEQQVGSICIIYLNVELDIAMIRFIQKFINLLLYKEAKQSINRVSIIRSSNHNLVKLQYIKGFTNSKPYGNTGGGGNDYSSPIKK